MSFDFELAFWIITAIAGMITMGVLWLLAKKNAETYLDWAEE